jgi:hypothetical protein
MHSSRLLQRVIGATNLELYRAKEAQAAGRMLHNYPSGYPTRAREDVDQRGKW